MAISSSAVVSALWIAALAPAPTATVDGAPPLIVKSFEVGSFRITSYEEFDGHPYPQWSRWVTLEWRPAGKGLSYQIQDSDARTWGLVSVSSGKNECSVLLDGVIIDAPDPNLFSATMFLQGCGSTLDENERKTAQWAIEAAKADFPHAFEAFKRAARELHGPSQRRCSEFKRTLHGSVCVRYAGDKPQN